MAKLNRERRLLERRIEKKARKDARKRASADGTPWPSEAPAWHTEPPSAPSDF